VPAAEVSKILSPHEIETQTVEKRGDKKEEELNTTRKKFGDQSAIAKNSDLDITVEKSLLFNNERSRDGGFRFGFAGERFSTMEQ